MKDAYYFPHDSNATNDENMIILLGEMGLEGYGIYWVLIEHLRDQPGFKSSLRVLKPLSVRFNSSDEKFMTVVTRYGLFDRDDQFFWSNALIERMQPWLDKSERARNAALARWNKDSNANALPEHSGRNARKGKEKKEEKKKEEIYNTYPWFDSDFSQAWKEFLKMRTKIKSPLTEYGEKLALGKLDKLAGDKAEIVNQSIEKCWKGLFEIKQNGQQEFKLTDL